jgi:uncharacterized protein with HEPN domain
MPKDALKYLDDIRYAISLVNEFKQDVNSFMVFSADLKLQSAIERQLAIIGEAVNQLSKLESPFVLENSAQIRGMRNILIHAYDSVDAAIVWGVVTKELPKMLEEVQLYLNNKS